MKSTHSVNWLLSVHNVWIIDSSQHYSRRQHQAFDFNTTTQLFHNCCRWILLWVKKIKHQLAKTLRIIALTWCFTIQIMIFVDPSSMVVSSFKWSRWVIWPYSQPLILIFRQIYQNDFEAHFLPVTGPISSSVSWTILANAVRPVSMVLCCQATDIWCILSILT